MRSWLIVMLLLAVLMAACADDDDDTDDAATSIPAAVETTAPADAADSDSTPTEADEEPTEEAEVTPTSEPAEEADATPTEESDSTATEDTESSAGTPGADATETDPDSTPDADETPSSQAANPEVEEALFEIVLASEDLSAEWTEINTSASTDAQSDLGICDAEAYAGIEERLASVEAEFEQDPAEGPFLIQSVAAYPEDQAIEAFEYARDITTDCTEWTDDEGIAYTLEPRDDYPQFGDESFVMRITVESPIGEVPGELVFVRVGGLLTFMGYIGLGDIDTADVTDIAEIAAEKMENADLDS